MKSIYKIMYHRAVNAPNGSQLFAYPSDHYPDEAELLVLLKELPKGYEFVSVERIYTLA